MKRIVFILLLIAPMFSFGMAGSTVIELASVKVNPNNYASVLRGAKFYAKNCMVCHTMRYLAYNKIAKKAGITLDKMPLEQKEWWLGIVPPDLTLIARQRSPAWLYTYFHSFYKDPDRPTGYNNLLMKDINMINVFAAYQGEQVLTKRGAYRIARESLLSKPQYYSVLELVKAGSMTPEEYDRTMTDLVNFLVYASDPAVTEHDYIGLGVIIFLIILAVMAYFLKKLYWKDVK